MPSEDRWQWDAIYRIERPRLIRQLARHLSVERAEDVVQQVFLRVASRFNAPREIEHPGAYLREAASNALRDQIRREGCEQRRALADENSDHSADPLQLLEARDRLARVEIALRRLRPLTREVFLACRVDGYSYQDIAGQTGLSVRGVEKQMSRAIKLLGHHLQRYD